MCSSQVYKLTNRSSFKIHQRNKSYYLAQPSLRAISKSKHIALTAKPSITYRMSQKTHYRYLLEAIDMLRTPHNTSHAPLMRGLEGLILGGHRATLVDELWIGLLALEAVVIAGVLGLRVLSAVSGSRNCSRNLAIDRNVNMKRS
ncbi:hypothetical protein F4779DRAFT_170437 [Xylariaceae sp. FL0662B]|nr:hypothetical protein F4779DRAFT_170437 [Xylariaceae sp. FL0662B]